MQYINAAVVFNWKFNSYFHSLSMYIQCLLRCSNFFYIYYLLAQWEKMPVLHQSNRLIKSLAAASLKIIMEIHFSLLFIIQIQIIFALKCH